MPSYSSRPWDNDYDDDESISSCYLMGVPSAIEVCLDGNLNVSALDLGVDSVSSILRDNYSLSSLMKKNIDDSGLLASKTSVYSVNMAEDYELMTSEIDVSPTRPARKPSIDKDDVNHIQDLIASLSLISLREDSDTSKDESDFESLDITKSTKVMLFRQGQSGSEQDCRSTGRCFEDSLRWHPYSNDHNGIDHRQYHASFPPSNADPGDFVRPHSVNDFLPPFCPRRRLSHGSESIHTGKNERRVSRKIIPGTFNWREDALCAPASIASTTGNAAAKETKAQSVLPPPLPRRQVTSGTLSSIGGA